MTVTVNFTTAVTQNDRFRNILDWSPNELGIVESMKSDELVSHIAALQQQLSVPVDGVLGPHTYAAVLAGNRAQRLAEYAASAGQPALHLELAGDIAVLNGKLAWLLDIEDGKKGTFPEMSRQFIDTIIRTSAGVNWTWEPKYEGDGRYEWCTTYVAYCYSTGAVIKLDMRTNFLSSTDRLDKFGQYLPALNHPNPKPATGPFRMMIELDEHSQAIDAVFPDGTLPRAGDLGMAGGIHTGPGKHGFLLTGWDPALGVAKTLEGNATGIGPRGNIRQGIIRGTRRVGLPPGASPTTYHLRRILRFGAGDFVG